MVGVMQVIGARLASNRCTFADWIVPKHRKRGKFPFLQHEINLPLMSQLAVIVFVKTQVGDYR